MEEIYSDLSMHDPKIIIKNYFSIDCYRHWYSIFLANEIEQIDRLSDEWRVWKYDWYVCM